MKLNALILLSLALLGAQALFAKSTKQEVAIKVTSDGFEPNKIKVKPGTHVVLNVTRTTDQTCATQIMVKEKNINENLPLNKEIKIDIGTLKKGEIKFACGMDMITGHILSE